LRDKEQLSKAQAAFLGTSGGQVTTPRS